MSLPNQRWRIHAPNPELAESIAATTGLSPLLAQVLINRGMDTSSRARAFLDPESEALPDPKTEFPDLKASLDLLQAAIVNQEKIAICGDYDVDGMTSTALLIRTLRLLNAQVDYVIPSRMTEGYGINENIVQRLHQEGVRLIITVDNGISAYGAIALAKKLGLAVIITDHHEVPPDPDKLPPADAILNPKYRVNPFSPYATIAGVGVAYILALELAERFGQRELLEAPLLELFALGTIADLAQLTGINRYLVKKGLRLLGRSKLVGVQALIHVAGLGNNRQTGLKPEAIGFSLGPRINAIGRIGNPQTVIELLTTNDIPLANERAMECEQTNRERQKLCSEIEQEAIAIVEAGILSGEISLERDRVLIPIKRGWHHGVIGIVASRLVERYGAPVFMCTYEESEESESAGIEHSMIRSSARGIPEFHVFEALEFAKDLLTKHGGHPAAGGFTMPAANLEQLRSRLRQFAQTHLTAEEIKPLITVDVQASLSDISLTLYEQINSLHPCGMGNPDPVFYSHNVRVVSQKVFGKKRDHLSLVLDRNDGRKVNAIAWRWGQYKLPERVDLAYKISVKLLNDNPLIELELVGVRNCQPEVLPTLSLDFPFSRDSSGHDQSLSFSPILECKPAPAIHALPQWHPITEFSESSQPVLLYGYNRPANQFKGNVDCDRPQRNYQSLILWSLPPSITHLRWLIALAKPQYIYVGSQIPPIPTINELRQKLTAHADSPSLNLLNLGQQLWVAPCTIVSALRDLGRTCDTFAATDALEVELSRLQRWYSYPTEKLQHILSLK